MLHSSSNIIIYSFKYIWFIWLHVLHMQYKLILPEPSISFPKSCDLWPCDLVSLSLTLVLKIKNRKGNQKNNKKENKKKLSLPLSVLTLTLPNDLFIVKFTNGRLKDLSILFYFIHFYFIFVLFSYFSIFRRTRVRVRSNWSQCHISHNLMVWS